MHCCILATSTPAHLNQWSIWVDEEGHVLVQVLIVGPVHTGAGHRPERLRLVQLHLQVAALAVNRSAHAPAQGEQRRLVRPWKQLPHM